jgi:hypothetical protein
MVAGYRACWQATQMLVHPLMKLARSLKTNSSAQLFSDLLASCAMPSDPVGFVLPSLLFFPMA